MFRKGLTSEAKRFLLLLLILSGIGLAADAFAQFVIIGLGVYICWIYINLYRLAEWTLNLRRRQARQHHFKGIWGEIADDMVLLDGRHEKDKLRLQEVVQRVQQMATALSDGVLLLDQRMHTQWWNRTAEEFFDLRAYDRGRKLTNILREPEFVRYFKKQDFDQPLQIESLRQPELYLQFQLYRFGQGEILIVVRDISQLHKLEQMRKDFVANVSHELRTPLTVLRGYIETLADSNELPARWHGALTQMEQQSLRMTSLINDLITLSKLETDERVSATEEVHIQPLVEMILNDAAAINHNDIILKSSGDNELILRGSEKELRSAISNLVFNAVKYSPSGSSVKVRYRVTRLKNVIISVTDNGSGIDPKHIPRLAERFYRADTGRTRDAGGTGLGLAIVKHVMLRHNGYLKIRSKLGRGSKFSLYFPLHRVVASKEKNEIHQR